MKKDNEKNSADIEMLKGQVKELNIKVNSVNEKAEACSNESVLAKVTERSCRERNLVLHGYEESNARGAMDSLIG